MVESNNTEERLARVERMLEAVQQESAAVRKITAELVAELVEVVVRVGPSLARPCKNR